MIKERTVFALGAGAHVPCAFPLGRQLVNPNRDGGSFGHALHDRLAAATGAPGLPRGNRELIVADR